MEKELNYKGNSMFKSFYYDLIVKYLTFKKHFILVNCYIHIHFVHNKIGDMIKIVIILYFNLDVDLM